MEGKPASAFRGLSAPLKQAQQTHFGDFPPPLMQASERIAGTFGPFEASAASSNVMEILSFGAFL